MLESQNFLDVQLVFTSTAVLRDSVDQHCDFRYWRIHPVEQAQFERHRNLLEALCPVGLDLAVFDLFRASDDFRQPLALNCRRYPVVINSHNCSGFPPWAAGARTEGQPFLLNQLPYLFRSQVQEHSSPELFPESCQHLRIRCRDSSVSNEALEMLFVESA